MPLPKHALTLALALTGLPTMGAAQTWMCEMQAKRADNWIAPQILVQLGRSDTQALVFDGIIKSVQDKPMTARLLSRTPSKISLRWDVKGLKDPRNAFLPNAAYRLTFAPKTGKAHASMAPAGYDNNFRTRGTCKTLK